MTYTTDPDDPRLGHGTGGVGMNEAYLVLTDEERAKGFVRPLYRAYKHHLCGGVTTMGLPLCETYARNPKFYGATYCATCGTHYVVGEQGEFTWVDADGTDTGLKVGT